MFDKIVLFLFLCLFVFFFMTQLGWLVSYVREYLRLAHICIKCVKRVRKSCFIELSMMEFLFYGFVLFFQNIVILLLVNYNNHFPGITSLQLGQLLCKQFEAQIIPALRLLHSPYSYFFSSFPISLGGNNFW